MLAQGHGSFFAAAPLRGPTGTVGTVFGYQGLTRDGRHLPAGPAVLGGTHSTWGTQIPWTSPT